MGALGKAELRTRRAGALVRWVLIYYTMSIAFVASSKSVLLRLPAFPWTLSFLQCAVAAWCARAWLASDRGPGVERSISAAQWRLVAAGSATCWLGFACANVACSVMNASLVETIKATTPIPQMLVGACMGEGWAPAHVRRALAVIVLGVMLASYADSSACLCGIVASLVMNVNFALADNIVKYSYKLPDRLDASNVWYRSAQLGTLFAAPAALVEVASCGPAAKMELTLAMQGPTLLLVLLSGCAFFLYNQSICELLGQVPISMFALLGSVRRAVTIAALMFIFRTEVTLLNTGGLCIVALGFTYFLTQQKAEGEQTSSAGKPSPSSALVHCSTASTVAPSQSPRSSEGSEDADWEDQPSAPVAAVGGLSRRAGEGNSMWP
mmetsp:Transcript_9311/g.26169  ORF Transcript_9311/g.26169 Transcript_9311/m.26169 type:complete len:382 (-) Transcript_9311:6-1151(-)